MKITFFSMKFPVSSETFVLNQITSLIDMGYTVEVVSVFPGDLKQLHGNFEKYHLLDKITYLLPSESAPKLQKITTRVCKVLSNIYDSKVKKSVNFFKYGFYSRKMILPAIVSYNKHVISSDVFIAHFGFSGALANDLRNIGFLKGKLATVFHGVDISQKDVLLNLKSSYRRLFTQGDYFLPISDLWARKLKELGCPRNKIHVIRMGVESDKFRYTERKQLNKTIRLISIARLVEKKGLEVAIKACRVLKENNIDFNYTIVGDGPRRENLTKLIQDLGLENDVHLVGFKSQEEIQKDLVDTDVFLLPSITARNGDMEGIPVALMEAMAVGLPVISTFHSGIPELIEDKVSGWLVPEGNSETLAKVIQDILNGMYDIDTITKNAREVVENKFNQSSNYERMIKLLERSL